MGMQNKYGESVGNMCIGINEIFKTFLGIKSAASPVGFYGHSDPGWLSEHSG